MRVLPGVQDHPGQHLRRAAVRCTLLALLSLALLVPGTAAAQEGPTPFWLPTEPGPAPNKPNKPKKPKTSKKPKKAQQQREKQQKQTRKRAQPPAPASHEPTRTRKREPLPALPHLVPDEPPASPLPARDDGSARPAPEPVRRPVLRPPKEIFDPEAPEAAVPPARPPERSPPSEPRAAEPRAPRSKSAPARPAEPAAVPTPARGATTPEPARTLPATPAAEPARPLPFVSEPPPASLRLRPEVAAVAAVPSAPPDPEESLPVPERWRRSFWLLALGGVWQKPRADGRAFEPSIGLQAGYALAPWLLVDLTALRAGSTQGSGFASASLVHTLLVARLQVAWSRGAFSWLGGTGFGGALSQTVYSLQDVGQPESTLPATALRTVLTAGAGLRVRPWRGLELRLEVNALLRDGRLEPWLVGGAGWSF